ncbi:transcriptional regulator [Escherichia coli]|nr:transcriptional regulator [Escherichia coli]
MTDINDVIKTIDELIDGGVLTQYAIAREAGISDGTLSAFRKGKYKGDNAAVAASLRSWYENWNKQSALPEPPQFVETQTVQELRALFQAVRLMGCINVIVGVPGVGKTATARNYCQEQPNTWMITLSPAHSSVTECLLELADALGIDYTRANKGALSRAIRRRLMGTRGLAIARAWGISGEAELAVMQAIAEKPGALRVLTHTLNQAWLTASGEGAALTEKHINAAFKEVYTNPELLSQV